MIDLGTFLERTFLARKDLYCVRFFLQFLPGYGVDMETPPPTSAYVTRNFVISDLVLDIHSHGTVRPLFRWKGHMRVAKVEMKGKDLVVYYRRMGGESSE